MFSKRFSRALIVLFLLGSGAGLAALLLDAPFPSVLTFFTLAAMLPVFLILPDGPVRRHSRAAFCVLSSLLILALAVICVACFVHVQLRMTPTPWPLVALRCSAVALSALGYCTIAYLAFPTADYPAANSPCTKNGSP